MATRTWFVSIFTVALVIICSSYVNAGIVTINFPTDLADPCIEICTHNTTADGLRISPEFHYDTFVVNGGGPGIGWDANNSVLNPDYLGPPGLGGVGLYIDHAGLLFSLLSLESLGEEMIAESSKGGSVFIPGPRFPPPPSPPPLHFDFVGPEWQDIQWVVFISNPPGVPTSGFDQLVTFVPGPPTLGLFGLGVLILGWRLRSSKGRTTRPSP